MECCNFRMILVEGVYGKRLPQEERYYKCVKCGNKIKATEGKDNHE